MKIYDEYVETQRLKVLYTHRMSQDLLETLFGCIRSMNGYNDNPISTQFAAAYRKLCVHNEVVCSKRANCIDQGTKILTVSSNRKPKSKQMSSVAIDPEFDEEEDCFVYVPMDESSFGNNLHAHSIAFIASSIEEKIRTAKGSRRIVKCPSCIRTFTENEVIQDRFIEFKRRTENKQQPCKSTVQICKLTESFLKGTNDQDKYESTVLKIMRSLPLDMLYPLSNFDSDEHSELNHKYNFIKCVVQVYLDFKSIDIAKGINSDAHFELIRSDLRKRIHFEGQ